jgi:hypothetical protein
MAVFSLMRSRAVEKHHSTLIPASFGRQLTGAMRGCGRHHRTPGAATIPPAL